jgi:DNA-binding NtrC family response regulator
VSPVPEQVVRRPLGLVVSGEARRHADVLRQLLGPDLVEMVIAGDTEQLLLFVQGGRADAVVVDSDRGDQEVLEVLRMIRRVNSGLPVVLVARSATRRFMEVALRLAAFSIVHKPLEREELLIQLRRIVERRQVPL